MVDEEKLYEQLGNNIELAFAPKEYDIANKFLTSGFSFKELQEILLKTNLSQVYRVKIENAYLDLRSGFRKTDDFDVWQNSQIDYFVIKKLRQ